MDVEVHTAILVDEFGNTHLIMNEFGIVEARETFEHNEAE